MNREINILICTPAFGGWAQIDYINSLMDYHRCKIPFTLMMIGSESLVTRARNSCISYFHAMKQFSHILFIDADMGFTGENLIKLISYNKDVIGVPVCLKGFDSEGNPVRNIGSVEEVGNGLYKTDRVGTAIFMLSRKAVDSLVEGADTYNRNPHTRGNNQDITHYDVFQVGVIDGVYQSEDFWVCYKLRELGYGIYIADLPNRHNGMYVFT